MSGYVYVMMNSSFPGLVKIGLTSRDPFSRAIELQTTGVPTPFEVLATVKVSDPYSTEQRLHARLSSTRVSGEREFFQLSSREAVRALLEESFQDIPLTTRDTASTTHSVDSVKAASEFYEPGAGFNPAAGRAMLERLAKQKNPEACLHLGKVMFQDGTTRGRDHRQRIKKPLKYIEIAAQAEIPEAFYVLASWHGDSSYLDAWLRRIDIENRVVAVLRAVRHDVYYLWNLNAAYWPTFPQILGEQSFIPYHSHIFKTLEEEVMAYAKQIPSLVSPKGKYKSNQEIAESIALEAHHSKYIVAPEERKVFLTTVCRLCYFTEFVDSLRRSGISAQPSPELSQELLSKAIQRLQAEQKFGRSNYASYAFSWPDHYRATDLQLSLALNSS